MMQAAQQAVSKDELERLKTETQRAAARNKLVVLFAFAAYAVLVGGSVALLPAAFTESALVASRKAIVQHWCGFAGFLTVFSLELVSFFISTDAAKTRVMVVTLGCSLMGACTYLLVALEIAPVMIGPASGFPVYPSKMLTWMVSTSLMIYVVWNAGDTPVSHLLRTLAFNTVMLVAGLVGFTSRIQYVPVAFACGMAMFCGMGYGQWKMIGMDAGDNPETHRANMAIFKVKCIMAACWLLFPATYAFQFVGGVDQVALESVMVFIDVLSKCILMSAIQQGMMCSSADRKQSLMQQMALDLVEDLKEADKRKDRFLATMTHELRTPLNGIVGITESLLLNYSKTLDDRVMKGIETVRDSGKRFSQLIANILDSASLSESKLRLIFNPVRLSKIVDEVALLIEPLLRNNTKLTVNVPPSLPLLDSDYDRLLQIMYNLMGNACKFTDDGEISVKATSEGGMMRIEVKDTGAGIAADKHKLIFQPFEQVDGSRTRTHGGTGLGLSLARSLVEAHDGTLTVRSELNKGSTFTALIPLKAKVKEAKTALIGRRDSQPKVSASPVQQKPEEEVPQRTLVNSSRQKSIAKRPPQAEPIENAQPQALPSAVRRPVRSAPVSSSNLIEKNTVRRQSSFTTMSTGNLASILREGFKPRGPRKSGGLLGQWLEGRDEQAVSALIRTEMEEDGGKKEIMVVDDEVMNQFLMKELLESVGFVVTLVSSGKMALETLTERFNSYGVASFPSLCLMDLLMPAMSGQDTMEEIHKKFPEHRMPIIMLSGVDDEPAMVTALSNGCVDYIVKPFKGGEFLARVGLQLRTIQSGMEELEASWLSQLQQEMFPMSVVDRLASGDKLIADVYSSVSFISIGINGLTNKTPSKRHEAFEMVSWLDKLFSVMDAEAQAEGLQFGIGSGLCTLMVGHEDLSSVDHAVRAVRFAQNIAFQAAHKPIDGISLRIGVHTGSAIAGVAGQRPPRYLFAGPALEVTQQLERTCRPTCIQVSSSTYDIVKGTSSEKKFKFHELHTPVQLPDGEGVKTYVMDVGEWAAAVDESQSELNIYSMRSDSVLSSRSGGLTNVPRRISEETDFRMVSAREAGLVDTRGSQHLTPSGTASGDERSAPLADVTPRQNPVYELDEFGERAPPPPASPIPPSPSPSSRSGRRLFSCLSSPSVVE